MTEIGSFTRPPSTQVGVGVPSAVPQPPISLPKAPSPGASAIAEFMRGTAPRGSMAPPQFATLAPAIATPAQPPVKQAEPGGRIGDLEAALAEAAKAPQLTYEERLLKHKISMGEAMQIVNSMFDKNYYEKEYRLTKSYSVTFKTRTTEDQNHVLAEIEARGLQYAASIAQVISTFNLAASMQKFKGIDLSQHAFDAKLKFVQGLSGNVLYILSKKLNEFDVLVNDVIDDGAVENF